VRRWLGVTTCATLSADVRELWERLLATEAARTDDMLRGEPGSVLDLADVVVSKADTLRLQLQTTGHDAPAVQRADVVALPRFTYELPPRKLRNVGHWLLDCVPHAWALSALAPDARLLLPQPAREVHWSALALAGITPQRVLAWNGEPIACRRLLVQETDGRIARGRPLPMLLDFRRHVSGGAAAGDVKTRRRIFVSRRDAKRHRQWMSNHDEVEALFRGRGFEILVMRESSMDAQLTAFREAGIVAGISGAGLANVVFSPAGTHVVTLLTDSLMRWYAEERGSRSTWAGAVPPEAPMTELSDSPRFYAHLAAACEQYCHTFVSGDALPLETLGRFLDDVLGVVNRE
jgi:capsular polysaccharide biosynthesis protein